MFRSKNSFLHPSASAPTLTKNHKQIIEKFKKIPIFLCCRQFDAWGPLQFSNHLDVWEAPSKKDKLGVCKNVYCSCTVLVRFVFFTESCSNVQMTWNLERASHIKLSTTQKRVEIFWICFEFFIIFLTRCRWAWAPKRPTRSDPPFNVWQNF